MRKKYQSYSIVNLTLNMRYKMTKKYQIWHHQIRFFKLKMHKNPAGGAYDAPPGSLVGLGRGIPLPYSLPRSTPSASGVPRFSGPLNTKSWLRQCSDVPDCAFCLESPETCSVFEYLLNLLGYHISK